MIAFLRACLAVMTLGTAAAAETRQFALSAPPELVEAGLLKHMLPRFSLKTGIRVKLVETGGEAALAAGAGEPALTGPGGTYGITAAGPLATRFADWLLSEVGQNTVAAFPPFSGAAGAAAPEEASGFSGDQARGGELALALCGRCHVIDDRNRLNGIGSTPSFGALRTFADWDKRFESFFTLNPHPSFTQIEGVTPPFPEERPAHIVPLELTMDQLEAILAFVTVLEPADLGAPVRAQ